MMREPESVNAGPIARVQEGMHVADAAGQDVGRVELVQMGYPAAATTEGYDQQPRNPLEYVAEAVGGEREPDVPEPLRSRLVRGGFIKIDGPGLLEADRYVASEYVREVAGDTVRLSVRKDELIRKD
jgi:hypothetical protein